MRLIIGNRNYSSWSLRGWLLTQLSGREVAVEVIPLGTPDTETRILTHSRAGRVPILIDEDLTVWDTYSIAEYLAESVPDRGLWPSDRKARAYARSITAEMHAGFTALRSQFPMNVRSRIPGIEPSAETERDIARICSIWQMSRQRVGKEGPFLFGDFNAVDAFYAPVVSRFETYSIDVDPVSRAYMDAVLSWPPMEKWRRAAEAEPWVIAEEEVSPGD